MPTTTTDFGNCLNGKLVLYLNDSANPKNELNLIPNLVQYQNFKINNKNRTWIKEII